MLRIKELPSQATTAILITFLVLTVAFSTSVYFWRSTLAEEIRMLDSSEILSDNRLVLADIRDAESGQRGYLLTHDLSYLQPYIRGTSDAPRDIDRLLRLTSGDAGQKVRVLKLRDAIRGKLAELAETITASQSQGVPAVIKIVKTNYGRETMKSARIISASIEKREQDLLLARTSSHLVERRIAIADTAVFGSLTLLLTWWVVKAYTTLNSVLECTSDSVLTLAFDWRVLYGNRRARKDLPDLKIGANYWKCFPELIGSKSEDLIRTAMQDRNGVSFENFYAPYQAWYKVEIFPSSSGLSMFFSDTTVDKGIQARLATEQLLREKRVEAISNMAGGLAHEISNPLAIIHGRAEDLRMNALDGIASTSSIVKACNSIINTTERANKILKGLKGFTREASQDPPAEASIYRIVDDCVMLQHSRFSMQNVELRINLDPGIGPISCRETQIGQIVTNLVNNAFDAVVQSEVPERWVSLHAQQGDGFMWLDVIDSGPGIADEIRAHLMEPFVTTKSVGGGTGIGLSLSKAIAIDHGGTLTLLEDTVHTSFRLSIPCNRRRPA